MPTVLDRLQQLARRGQGLKPVALILAVVLFLLSAGILVLMPGTGGDQFLLPTILGCVWATSGFLFIYLFEAVPPPPEPTSGMLARAQRGLVRGSYWLLAVAFVILSALVLMLSIRLIGEWRGALPD